MTDTTVVLTDDYLEAARELAYIAREKKTLEAAEKRCKEIIAKHLAEGDTGVDPETGQMLVQVKRGARVWNETEARKNLPADMLARITRTVTEERVDKELAKDILPPALYDLCTKANKPSVVAL